MTITIPDDPGLKAELEIAIARHICLIQRDRPEDQVLVALRGIFEQISK